MRRPRGRSMSEAVSTSTLTLPTWSKRFKKGALIGAGVLALLVTAILVVPQFVDLGLFKRTYLPLIEDALSRRVDVDEVRLSLIPTPSIRLSKLKVSDSPTFAGNTFFAAQQVQLKLKLWPLLRGRFEVTELVLDKPIFNLLKQPDGTFNYSDIAHKKAATAAGRREAKKKQETGKSADMAAAPILIPGRMRVRDGELNLTTRGQTPVNIKGIELSLEEFTSDKPIPFQASFNYPGLKTVALDGQLDYQEEKALLELKNNRLKIHDLNLPVQGSVSNLSGVPRVNLS